MSRHLPDRPHRAERTIPGTLRALAVSYFASPAFRTTRPSTQYTYRNIIDRLCIEHGDKRVALLQPEHVIKLLAARAATPTSANALRRSLRGLMRHALEIGNAVRRSHSRRAQASDSQG
jgi:hypothetical protein